MIPTLGLHHVPPVTTGSNAPGGLRLLVDMVELALTSRLALISFPRLRQ